MILPDKYLKEYSPLPLNIDLTDIHPYIALAEDTWLLDVIGEDLYNELQEQIDDNELTDENSTLLISALWPYLAFAVVYEALPTITYHFSEVGVTKGKSDNSDSIDMKELSYMQNHLRSQVEARKDFLINWLCDRADSFPLYDSSKCSCSCTCGTNGQLNKPNPYKQLYSTPRIQTDIK